MTTKIRPAHLARPALVYIRQSTLLQVHEHRESTERQYALVELAKKLGWDATQVEVIDEDLGQSGASSARRKGFQRLTAEVSLGKVGAVLSLEVSRLARSHPIGIGCSTSARSPTRSSSMTMASTTPTTSTTGWC
jgi:DNA invertase Pin-like site-specific DNA recombinase